MWLPRRIFGVLAALLLGCVAARADDGHKPADPPDSGFLEFLGSVDRLVDVNPEYLAQADAAVAVAGRWRPSHGPPPAPSGTGGPSSD